MTAEQILQIAQIIVSLATLGGIAFAVGRLYGRIDHLSEGQKEVKDALFGTNGNESAFLRRSEAELMRDQEVAEHAAFDKRLEDFNVRLGRVEHR